MPKMNEIKQRMKSINDTRQITKAMKLISAAKLKRARIQLEKALPYFDMVKITMADILMHTANIDNKFFDFRHEKKGRKIGYVILTGDKGLAGAYNHSVVKTTEAELAKHPGSLLFVMGHVGWHYFLRKKANIDHDFDYPVHDPNPFRAREIAEYILKAFDRGRVDEVQIIYTFMKSTFNLQPEVMQLLPLDPEELKMELHIERAKVTDREDIFMYEPSPAEVFNVLIPKYVKGIIYGAMVESFTSEQSSRMTSMDNATRNADDMLKKLKLTYNRARQAAITQEMAEITGG